jgi:molecular chaperone HtpG
MGAAHHRIEQEEFMTTYAFQTEVNQLLHLIIHSLYSHKEIFLRELISNASDALDKLKHLTLTDERFKQHPFDPRIDITFDEQAKTLEVRDAGIGMDEADLREQLGTIARSGTKAFIEQLSGEARKDSNLIGQFGVGFYSSFMVADTIEVTSRKAGDERAWRWVSDGKGEYSIAPAERDSAGTTVLLRLNDNGAEYASRWSLEGIIKKYSNHIAFPIYLHYDSVTYAGEGDKRTEQRERKTDKVNDGTALWRKSKTELSDEDYNAFYKTIGHDSEDPLLHVHTRAEGTLEYTTLFYVPRRAPLDMYYADYRPGVKLYVRRVFITDDDKELMPPYLRFVRGIIDSEDLPLNVSREILQQNRVLAKIRASSVKKLLEEFKKLSEAPDTYAGFYEQFGRPLKEGLYQDYENREKLLDLVRFKSTRADGWVSLDEYVGRMQPEQKAIYYISGDNEDMLRKSPLLEMYRRKDIEVLLMVDDIDDLVIPAVARYKDHAFTLISRSDAADDLKTDEDKQQEELIKPLIERVKNLLGDDVKDVKASTRLSDSPACLVLDGSDPTLQMQELLRGMGQKLPDIKPILELNPRHAIIRRMESMDDTGLFGDAARLLLEEAMLLEGMELKDPAGFVQRLNRVLDKAL